MKNVLITGGTRGIGKASVEIFTKKGFRVFVIYEKNHDAAEMLKKDTLCHIYQGDIKDSERISEIIKEITSNFGEIDILVNNAGISEQKLFIDTDKNSWNNMIDTNLNSIYNVTYEVVKSMLKKNKGSIINVSSIWGECGASCEVHYSAAKAGVIGFTKALAKELGLSGIRVNCITPGIIDTDMNSHLSDEDISDIVSEIPLGRVGKASECAELIYFLASSDASYITGQVIGINGGWNM